MPLSTFLIYAVAGWAGGVLVSIFCTQFVVTALGLAVDAREYKQRLGNWKNSVHHCYNRSSGGGYCSDGNICREHQYSRPSDAYQQKGLDFHCLWFINWPLIGSDFFGKVLGKRVNRIVHVPSVALVPQDRVYIKDATDEVNRIAPGDAE